MAALVYILCLLTSLACAVLLLAAFVRTRTRLLLWSGICFVGLAISNAALAVNKILLPEADLFALRAGAALIGLCALIYGLVWEGQ